MSRSFSSLVMMRFLPSRHVFLRPCQSGAHNIHYVRSYGRLSWNAHHVPVIFSVVILHNSGRSRGRGVSV